jgi:DNA invertase Pin-like site-specific DNA recombinase
VAVRRLLHTDIRHLIVWSLLDLGGSRTSVVNALIELQGRRFHVYVVGTGAQLMPIATEVWRLVVSVLQESAEIDRRTLSERTRAGLIHAREGGKRIGRPPGAGLPDPMEVIQLRRDGHSWKTIARQLGCSESTARRRAMQSNALPSPSS